MVGLVWFGLVELLKFRNFLTAHGVPSSFLPINRLISALI